METSDVLVEFIVIVLFCFVGLLFIASWANSLRKRNLSAEEEQQYSYYLEETETAPDTAYTAIAKRTEYPFDLDDYIGQTTIVENLQLSIKAAEIRDSVLPHIMLYGPAGLGKTTLAELVAQRMQVPFITFEGTALEDAKDVLNIVSSITRGSIVFIDEIHQMSRLISELWYKVMENFRLDHLSEGSIINTDIPRFTTIGATTDFGLLLKPFRDRFVHTYELQLYTDDEIKQIIHQVLNITQGACSRLAMLCQRTPRLVRNYATNLEEIITVYSDDIVRSTHIEKLQKLKGINTLGLSRAQMRVLEALKHGNKMGVKTLAVATNMSPVDLERSVEPFLLQSGYITRTSRGREITDAGILVVNGLG